MSKTCDPCRGPDACGGISESEFMFTSVRDADLQTLVTSFVKLKSLATLSLNFGLQMLLAGFAELKSLPKAIRLSRPLRVHRLPAPLRHYEPQALEWIWNDVCHTWSLRRILLALHIWTKQVSGFTCPVSCDVSDRMCRAFDLSNKLWLQFG